MGTKRNEMADNATTRSQVYALLTIVFRAEPSEAFLKELQGPRFSEALSELGVDLGSEYHAKTKVENCQGLAVEFTRLFLGPGQHISAHESVFAELDGGFGGHWGAQTAEVKKFIEATGMEYASDFNGLPDHISVELEFMQKLAEWELEKWANDDDENAEYCLSVQKKFIEEHLLKWVPQFCSEVIDKADQPFYREMAGITVDFLEFDRILINKSLSSSVPS